MAQIVCTDYGVDYITVEVSGMSTSAKHIEFYISNELDKYYALSGTSQDHTYTGLSPGTTYRCSVIVYDANWETLTFAKNWVDQTTDSDRPSDWEWETTGITKGSEMDWIEVDGKICPAPITASEWLAFMDRVKEFYAYVGSSVDSTYWYRAVNGVKTGLPMTKTQANAARYLVEQLPIQTTLPAEVSPRSTITAWFFNGLKLALNSIE